MTQAPKPSPIALGRVRIRRGRLWRAAIRILSSRQLDFEEESRRLLYGGLVVIAISILTGFGFRNLLGDSRLEGIFDFLVAGFCLYSVVAIRNKMHGTVFYRIAVALLGLLFIYLGTLGSEHGHRAIWILTYPIFAIFMLGARHGLAYTLILFAAWIGFFFLPTEATGAADYPSEFVIRFVICFMLITFVAVFAERVREIYFVALNQHSERLRSENLQLALAEDEMRDLANRDELTGSPNRRAILTDLHQQLARAASTGSHLAVALIDLDRFKSINDSYGHAGGDEILIQFVRFMATHIRHQDRFGRYGGEEFLLLLPQTSQDALHAILERIRRSIERHDFSLSDACVNVTVSIGAASATGAQLDADEMLRAADQALYAAKHAGRNRVVLASEI